MISLQNLLVNFNEGNNIFYTLYYADAFYKLHGYIHIYRLAHFTAYSLELSILVRAVLNTMIKNESVVLTLHNLSLFSFIRLC